MLLRGCLALLVFVLACGGPAAGVKAPATEDARGDAVQDAGLVPADASVVLHLPGYAALRAMIMPSTASDAEQSLLAEAGAELERKLGIAADDAAQLIASLGPTSLFLLEQEVALVTELAEGAPVAALLALPLLEARAGESQPGAVEVYGVAGDDAPRLAWLADRRTLVLTSGPAPLAAVLARARGEGTAFATAPEPQAVTLHVDLSALAEMLPSRDRLRGALAEGSQLSGRLRAEPEGLRSRFELKLRGPRIPALGAHLAPAAPRLPARLPAETVGFLSLSLARQSGRGLRDVLGAIAGAAGDRRAVDMIDAAAKSKLGAGIDDIDAALGDELVVGLIADPDATFEGGPAAHRDDGAVVVALGWRDAALAEQLIAKLHALLRTEAGDSHRVTGARGALRLDPNKPGKPAMQLSAAKDALLFRIGGARWLDRAAASFDRGERTLGETDAYRRLRQPPASLSAWVSASRIGQLVQQPLAMPSGTELVGRARIGPATEGLDVVFEAEDGMETAVVGVAAALAIYSVRRYLAAAKTAEAKSTVAAIARGALAGFEREHTSGPMHQLCDSAPPVPAQVPAGTKHAPGDAFDSGDERGGWRCLRFSLTTPHYYQYEYRRGGPYKGPARGGPDPGPHGFEASAEGDLDGDGVTSLFTRTGTIDPRTEQVVLSPTIFIADEFE